MVGERDARNSPVAAAFADHWPPLVARLVAKFGDLTLAEDCASEAFTEAARQWDSAGPANPGGWLWTAASRRAIDTLRRQNRYSEIEPMLASVDSIDPGPASATSTVDRPQESELALLFGCCHPALAQEAQVALTLRYVNGLSTAQIADAFLVRHDTMTRRLSRAKTKVAAAAVPFEVPSADRWGERLDAVLQVVYLTFTAGHSTRSGPALVRGDLCDEARWLANLLTRLAPGDGEVLGLAALIALTDARRDTRLTPEGDVVLLADQDRSRWDQALITEGKDLLLRARGRGRLGPFQLQALIAAAHSTATQYSETDWAAIVRLYDVLALIDPSPVVRLNRAVAKMQADGPEAVLSELAALTKELPNYRYAHVSLAEACEQMGQHERAIAAWETALDCEPALAEREFIEKRLAALGR